MNKIGNAFIMKCLLFLLLASVSSESYAELILPVPACSVQLLTHNRNEKNFLCKKENKNKKYLNEFTDKVLNEKVDLNKPTKNLDNLFKLIEMTETGKKIIKKFKTKFKKSEITIKEFNEKTRKNLNIADNRVAIFKYNGKSKVIYIDYNTNVGILLPVLVHEITHSLDALL